MLERVGNCEELALVVVATDDERIATEARSLGAEVAMTSPDHPSGTDRVAEAVQTHPGITHVINIQGDEPLIDPSLVDSFASSLQADPELPMITAASPITDLAQLDDPNIVKVVIDRKNRALYFSRSSLPHLRTSPEGFSPLRHIGLYGYRRDFLTQFVNWPPSALERAEQLEQLRALENGARIEVVVTDDQSIGLDTPEQVPQLEALLAANSSP